MTMNSEFRIQNSEFLRMIILYGWWLIPALFFIPANVQALTISPLRHTVVIDPGREEEVTMVITNDSSAAISLTPEIDAFQLDPETGTAIFGARDEAVQWVETEETELSLGPGAARLLAFRIAVPKGAEPGSHYLGLFVGTAPAEGTVGVGSRLGTLLFLHVAGEVHEEVTREDFFASRSWYARPPIQLSLWLKNNGTIHVVPAGELVLQKGKRVIDRQAMNGLQRKILPGERWEEQYRFDHLGWRDAGRIEAVVSLQYGITRQPIVDRISFWYVPIGLLAAMAAVGLLLILAVWLTMKKKRKNSSYHVIE